MRDLRWIFRLVGPLSGFTLGGMVVQWSLGRVDVVALILSIAAAALGMAAGLLEIQLFYSKAREEVWKRLAEREYPLQRVEP